MHGWVFAMEVAYVADSVIFAIFRSFVTSPFFCHFCDFLHFCCFLTVLDGNCHF
uniref:Uncharacterized protein n=2 Tax=Anguilla anguilla TaxID=7936 RepID=A0A0E9QAP9_ANGAN